MPRTATADPHGPTRPRLRSPRVLAALLACAATLAAALLLAYDAPLQPIEEMLRANEIRIASDEDGAVFIGVNWKSKPLSSGQWDRVFRERRVKVLVFTRAQIPIPTLEHLQSLKALVIRNHRSVAVLPSLDGLTSLTSLGIAANPALINIPPLNKLSALKLLEIADNDTLETIPDLRGLQALEELTIRGNYRLLEPPKIDGLRSLKKLGLSSSGPRSIVPKLRELPALEELAIGNPPVIDYDWAPAHPPLLPLHLALTTLPDLSELPSLRRLGVYSSATLASLSSLGALAELETLHVRGIDAAEALPDLSGLSHLRTLCITRNRSLRRIPDLSRLPNLQRVYIDLNPSLLVLPDLPERLLIDVWGEGTRLAATTNPIPCWP